MTARYVNPYTDFGFKKLFGEEANKDLLIDFLNQLLPESRQIRDLDFRNPYQMTDLVFDRRAVFDIFCEGVDGERFIVEMQKSKFIHFKERAIFYSTFPIRDQAEKGDWDFRLKPVYCVGILDFVFDNNHDEGLVRPQPYYSYIQLKDQHNRPFYDKLTYIFLEMPLFKKAESQLETHFDKWLYFLKHLEDFNDIPAVLNEPVFRKGFKTLELAGLNREEAHAYDASLKTYRDLYAAFETKAVESYQEGFQDGEKSGVFKGKIEGKEEGRKEERHQIAADLKAMNYPIDEIIKITKLTEDEIADL